MANDLIKLSSLYPFSISTIRRYHKHLHDGIKSDAVSGWLLYASFYYVLGQYNTTLKIIDFVRYKSRNDCCLLTML
jgi:hypothetical protein